MSMERKQRVLIVSNRLPVTVSKDGNGNWNFRMSSGGLVSALGGVKKSMTFNWIGWPGLDVPETERPEFETALIEDYSCIPVYIDEKTADLHYNGFSNSTIWPLFHYLPGDIEFDEDQWAGYKRANEKFAEYLANVVQDGDLIWVHDYHLMLLPGMLREKLSQSKVSVNIGFFLHIPFPSSEIYRVLPKREEVLEGLLHADLIGFHTYDYARHFLSACTRILGLNTSPTGVQFKNRQVKVEAFPVGIDPKDFVGALETPEVKEQLEVLKKRYEGKKIMVGVDRLDYIKGVPHKILAFEALLERYPEYQNNVVLVQVAIPTRTDVPEYQKLQSSVFELVGKINGKYSNLDFAPIQFLNKSVNFTELVALYRLADVCLVTSTRDGMNLVSYEFIASQDENYGTLVLSEFAGAAQSFNGAIICNPWNIDDLIDAYRQALTLPHEARRANHLKLFSYVNKFTSAHWGSSFIHELNHFEAAESHENVETVIKANLSGELKKLKLLILNLDNLVEEVGTLNVSSFLQGLKKRLLGQNADICLLSSRSREYLEFFYSKFNFHMAAECGIWLKLSSETANNTWVELPHPSTNGWKEQVVPLLKHYNERTPGSFIEDKAVCLSWHYENVEAEFGLWQVSELQVNLEKAISHFPVRLLRTNATLEIVANSWDHSMFLKFMTENTHAERLIYVGSSNYDQRLFTATKLLEKQVDKLSTLTIGLGGSADFTDTQVRSWSDLLDLLN